MVELQPNPGFMSPKAPNRSAVRKKMRRASNLSQLAAEASFEREMKGASLLCCFMEHASPWQWPR